MNKNKDLTNKHIRKQRKPSRRNRVKLYYKLLDERLLPGFVKRGNTHTHVVCIGQQYFESKTRHCTSRSGRAAHSAAQSTAGPTG